MRQSNLLLHFLSMVKFVVRSFGVEECTSRKCLPIEEEEDKNDIENFSARTVRDWLIDLLVN